MDGTGELQVIHIMENNTETSYQILDNNSTYGNRTSKNVADAELDKESRIIVLWIQIVLGTIGGLAVCVWLWCNRRRKSRVNVIICHLTISDLLVMVATLTQVIWEMLDRWWYAGDAVCRIVKFFQGFSMLSASFLLVLLSLDRHQAIRSPLRNPPTVWKVALPCWLFAAILSVPMFFLFHAVSIKDTNSTSYNKTVCESTFRHLPTSHRQAFLTSMSILHVFAPCIIIAICYIRIFLKISQKANAAQGTVKFSNKPGKFHLQSTHSSSLPKAKIKTLKMTVVIVSLFIICGLPYHILEMLYNFWSHEAVPKIVASILGALPVANSVLNPYIFLAFNANCQNVKAVLCKNEAKMEYGESKTHSTMYCTRTTLVSKHQDYHSTDIELTNK